MNNIKEYTNKILNVLMKQVTNIGMPENYNVF